MQRTKSSPISDQSARHATASRGWFWGAVLVALVLFVYQPTLGNGFIWDDDMYIETNTTLESLDGLRDIWFKIGSVPQYYPLVFTTFWVEYHLWGTRPVGYHVVNLALHAAAVLLVWRLLVRLAVPGAWLAAAIFAVHPVCVESVAWATERKNVLSLSLALGSLLAYLRFLPPESPLEAEAATAGGNWRYYLLSFVLFAAAVLSKTVAVSVPAVLLVIYWWKRGRVTPRAAALLAPFFALGLVLSWITVHFEETLNVASGEGWDFSLAERTLIAGRAAWFYVGKLLWPHPLVMYYPRWTIDSHAWWQWAFPAAVVALIAGLWMARERIGRGPLAAVLVFGGVLVPALGFFNVFWFCFSFVSDHFQYHASVAMIALAAASITLASRPVEQRAPWLVAAGAAALLATLALVARGKTTVYKDAVSVYEDTLSANPAAWAAHHNLGAIRQNQGKYEEAMAHYRAAIEANPRHTRVRNNMASALIASGRLEEAAEEINLALASNLDNFDRSAAYAYAGDIAGLRGDLDEAIDHYRRAVELRPENFKALHNWGMVLAQQGHLDEALEMIRQAARLNADRADAEHGLGVALLDFNRMTEALTSLEAAVRLEPSAAKYREDLAKAMITSGDAPSAESHLRHAILLEPTSANAHFLLGIVLANKQDLAAAIAEFELALKHAPRHQGAAENLRKARDLQRQPPP